MINCKRSTMFIRHVGRGLATTIPVHATNQKKKQIKIHGVLGNTCLFAQNKTIQ